MQVQKNTLSLFDYIGNSSNTDADFEQAIARQKSNIGSEIRGLQSDFSAQKVDDTLERLQNGDTSLSLQTIDNMLNFNMISVSKDLQQMADDLGINSDVNITHVNGQWQVQGTTDGDRALQQLQTYLDRNKGLQTKLNTINQLSEMVELGKSQAFAKQLQEADISEPDVVTYLTKAREYLFSIDSFSLSNKHLSLTSQGEAENFFAEIKQTLGLSDSKTKSE
ncbi:hypothetical protein [Paraglaciecola sp.]|uniref:hypothetical protein n=1 Tax=Paraglaciecola sp. TaxID=1920173 RepID=UPI0030F38A92